MSRSARLLVTLVMLMALATSFAALAQEATEEPGNQGTTGQQDTTDQQGTTGQGTTTQQRQTTGSQQANGLPTGATLIDIVRLTGYDTYTFDLSVVGGTGTQRAQTGQQFGQLGMLTTQLSAQDVTLQQSPTDGQLQSCGNVRVYKVSSQGSQDLWPNIGCAGNLLTIRAGGTGDYIFYRFSSAQVASGALLTMPLCPSLAQPTQQAQQGQATAQPTQQATQQPGVSCFWVQAQNQLTGTQATGQQQATAQPTDTGTGDDGGNGTDESDGD